jgi:NAD-specific glutamate dehydrogenase
LFTSTAYTRSTRSIPYLRRKVDAVVRRAGFDPDGHSGKALVNVLENYPRDELFQIDDDTLHNFALTVLQLDERPRVRVLARRDRFDRFVSILVYVPRERFSSLSRAAIGEFMAETYKATRLRLLPVLHRDRAWCTPSSLATRARRPTRTARASSRRSPYRAHLGRCAARGARPRP